MAEKRPLLAFAGGFLGAGKTTLILKAAELLQARGLRTALIMNDQDAGLVDTELARARQWETREVSGGCFCCHFSDLMEAADQLAEYGPDIILAEPVGSCIDLSATILQPLKAFHRQEYRLAPLTVLLDPAMAEQSRRGELAPEVEYLFTHQLSEADLVCVTKRDLHEDLPELMFPIDYHLSGKTGDGVEEWLDEILAAKRVVGARLLDIDYRQYAVAEAALGWLNVHAGIRLLDAVSPAALCGPLLDELQRALTQQNIWITHLKIFDRASSGWIRASISNGQDAAPEGDLLADPSRHHELALNLRAIAEPDLLRDIVTDALQNIAGAVEIQHLGAFRPAEPKPEHRFAYRI